MLDQVVLKKYSLQWNNTGYFQSKKPSEGPLQVPLGVTSLKFPVTEEQTDLILETEGDPILLLRSLPRPSFCYTHTHARALRVAYVTVANKVSNLYFR